MSRATARLAAGALAVVLTACEVTAPDRSDAYGFRSQPDSLVFRWDAAELPVRFYVQPVGRLPEWTERALSLWHAQLLYGEFVGELTSDSASARVRVELEGGEPPDAPPASGTIVPACDGRTTLPVSATNQLTGPVVVRLRWFSTYTPEQVTACLEAVTAHEVGHALGLLQHSDDPDDLMFGTPFGFTQVSEPSARDRFTLQRLYHTPRDIEP